MTDLYDFVARTQQVINMMWTAYSTKTKPNLPDSTPVQTGRWKELFGPIRSLLSYHETRAEPSSISISLCFRPMKEQGIWCRRKLQGLYTFRTNLVDNLLCPWNTFLNVFNKDKKVLCNFCDFVAVFSKWIQQADEDCKGCKIYAKKTAHPDGVLHSNYCVLGLWGGVGSNLLYISSCHFSPPKISLCNVSFLHCALFLDLTVQCACMFLFSPLPLITSLIIPQSHDGLPLRGKVFILVSSPAHSLYARKKFIIRAQPAKKLPICISRCKQAWISEPCASAPNIF